MWSNDFFWTIVILATSQNWQNKYTGPAFVILKRPGFVIVLSGKWRCDWMDYKVSSHQHMDRKGFEVNES
jgi:hypothetical protein